MEFQWQFLILFFDIFDTALIRQLKYLIKIFLNQQVRAVLLFQGLQIHNKKNQKPNGQFHQVSLNKSQLFLTAWKNTLAKSQIFHL